MPRFAANLSMLFTDLPFLDRFDAAATAGFRGVEYLFPYEYSTADLTERLRSAQLTQALFNLPPGDWTAGERGLAALPGREREFAAAVDLGLEYAVALGCERVHAMAGIRADDDDAANASYVANLRLAADRAAEVGITVLLEPINRRDMPGYFLGGVPQALGLIEQVDRPNVRLQLDLYHAQITHGDVTRLLQATIEHIDHVQIASVPERHEPDGGELCYPYLLGVLDDAGYAGWVGCEYHPAGETQAGLRWLQAYEQR